MRGKSHIRRPNYLEPLDGGYEIYWNWPYFKGHTPVTLIVHFLHLINYIRVPSLTGNVISQQVYY